MNRGLITALLAIQLAIGCQSKADFVDQALSYCAIQVDRSIEQLQSTTLASAELSNTEGVNYNLTPRNIATGETSWNLREVRKEEWIAGFWPGVLWYDYEFTQNDRIKHEAENYTAALEFLSRTPAYDHDLGFLVYCSYGNGYRLTGNPHYKEVILRTADTLATLFNPEVGTILSWPREVETFGGHNTIMDNLINLEMMFWASENGGSSSLRDMAIMHADTTMKYNFRDDGSSYHVAVYNPAGGFIRGCTHQGYADDSMWARGQAWGIYGYTVCYRFTKDVRYLEFAQKITDLYLDKLPADMVPYWDFNDPQIPNVSRDASTAAIVASALLELSTYLPSAKGVKYQEDAQRMLRELHRNYKGGDAPALLLHSTGHRPAGTEIDYAIIYADYYYYEALLRLRRLETGGSVF